MIKPMTDGILYMILEQLIRKNGKQLLQQLDKNTLLDKWQRTEDNKQGNY